MNELQIFNNPEFGIVRTTELNGKTYFVANDVAKALGYSECAKAIRTHCKGVSEMDIPSNGGIQTMKVIPEGDIYRLVIRSKLPSAEKFEKWVFDEVLPSIRQNGGYISGQEELSEQELMAKALMVAQKTIERRNFVIKKLEEDAERMRPKEIFADAITSSKTVILIGELAKILNQNGIDTGEKRLFKWMREKGYLTKNNLPTQRASELKIFRVCEGTRQGLDGETIVTHTTKVTPKGQQYFINKFLANKEIQNV